MRTYERTHHWLKFSLDLRQASPDLWMKLGEAQSKCEHIAGVPLDKETEKQLHLLYLTKGALATTAIEGNTLTEEEVRARIEGQLELPLSKEYLGQEIDNIVNACNEITKSLIDNPSAELSVERIRRFNRQILHKLPMSEEKSPGEIRQVSVGVGRYRGAPAEDCDYLLERLCRWINEQKAEAGKKNRIANGILRAIIAHIYLVWIHPFADGNGRTARLIEFMILLDAGVPSPAVHLLSNHYNQTRMVYYQELDKASRSGGDLQPFMEYALQGLVDGLKEQLMRIRDYQWDVIWRDYVYKTFKTHKAKSSSTVNARRRDLVLALPANEAFTPIRRLNMITPEIARAYAEKTTKTISRDLNVLEEMGLVQISKSGVRARRDSILAFLPMQKHE